MEFGSILQFLENRSILVTGATGFLAKIFTEKILRVQPNVKKLYLLLRATDSKSAILRFNTEVISKDLFRVLKEKWGGNLNSLISQKVTVVAGDITCDNLGVKDSYLLEEMFKEIDIVVNLAATTNFDERYDVAIGINTLGAKHVLDFAKNCAKLKVLVHVSTAYVSGETEGLIKEDSYKLGETLNGTSGLDIDTEKNVVAETLNQLRAENSSEESIKSAMKNLGIQRARKYGWPNTYVFTKAMGEMLLGHLKDNVPLVIIRPTIVTSTYKEPFPAGSKIPADMVVNAIVVSMVAHANQPNEDIYHVGSSVSNPVEFTRLQDCGFQYFTKHPWINKDGKPVIVGKVTVLSTMASFHRYMAVRYLLPLKGLQIVNAACCQYFQGTYLKLYRKIKFVMRLIELYGPYLFFKGVYDDMNTEKLRRSAKGSCVETDIFYFDPKSINWDDYFMNTHIPGVVKHVFK